jgi:hypothetical protein
MAASAALKRLVLALSSLAACALRATTPAVRATAPARPAVPRRLALDRRTTIATVAAGALGALGGRPSAARAEPEQANNNVVLVLRVQEACSQEKRLIKSGKFKDVQRANIKLAVNLMLTNYALLDNVNQASTLARGRSQEALNVGVGAVEALQQVLDYFDSSSKSLKVDTISSEKQEFVVKALDVAAQRIDSFLTYLPAAQVDKAKALIAYENDLNLKEYAEQNQGEKYLNPTPGA